MNNYFTIDGKYWAIIDEIIAEYKATNEYSNRTVREKTYAANWLTDRLNKSAPLGKLAAECFTITESEIYGLIKIVEECNREDTAELLEYLRNHKGDENGQTNS